ncbi:hypothetical protein C2W62_23550, partial [Candidatus Entotheonella serta]
MREVAESIEELWDDYPVYIWTNAYKEDGIYYTALCFFDLWDWVDVYDKFNTRIYYAAKRHGLTFSRPIEYRSDAADLKPVMDMQKVIDMLQSHSLFEALE